MGGLQTINESSYVHVVCLPKNIIKPYTVVSIWIFNNISIFDDKFGSFLHNILKIQINIHQNTQNICHKSTYSFQTTIKKSYSGGSGV